MIRSVCVCVQVYVQTKHPTSTCELRRVDAVDVFSGLSTHLLELLERQSRFSIRLVLLHQRIKVTGKHEDSIHHETQAELLDVNRTVLVHVLMSAPYVMPGTCTCNPKLTFHPSPCFKACVQALARFELRTHTHTLIYIYIYTYIHT